VAMRLLSPEELEAELSRRNCSIIGKTTSGVTVWQTEDGEPFSVMPPEEPGPDGKLYYPDWILDDIIRQVGIPTTPRPRH
jgi:hypothetical protein